MFRLSKIFISFILVIGIAAGFNPVFADVNPATSSADLQSQIDADNQQIQLLTKQIAEYRTKLQQLGSDKKTLQDAINTLDLQRQEVQTQVAITQRQINSTQLQIQQLGGQIDDTQKTILTDKAALASYIQQIQQADDRPLLVQVLSDGDLGQFWDDMTATLQAQSAVREKTDDLKNQEQVLSNTQTAVQQKEDALASQKQDLASQQASLSATVKSKSQLLSETKSQEANYQKLLAQAQEELNSLSEFTKNAGGAGLVGEQTVCDAWGCYYNQRDSAWGDDPLNGTKFTLASDGCLVTDMAMIMTHYGYKTVTPMTINSNPANFASYYPAFLLYTIVAGGGTATRITSAIDATLAGGDPVVVGLHAYGGTHYVVFVSGSNGNYVMRDPYLSQGKDISFSGRYSMRQIFSAARVVIGG